MLQAYIDDSGRGQEPAFVLAGFISSPEKWAVFSDEWAAALGEPPRIEYFKMAEAQRFKNQFNGWERQDRDEKVAKLFRIIEKHVIAEISLTLDVNEYKEVFHSIECEVGFASYFLSVFHLVKQIAIWQDKCGLNEKIDFIFDRQEGQESRIRDAWDLFKKIASPKTRTLIGSPPDFKDDADTMPLQAADFHAWWVRRRRWENQTEKPQLGRMWEPTIKHMSFKFDFTKEKMEELKASILASLPFPVSFTYGSVQYRAGVFGGTTFLKASSNG